ncbi:MULTISPECIES: ImmA/IrrE family metallo-endopeptidase [unclassified Sporosarcina]|uniref:ImmA/IrrE family metallo-endopeptidase n=1 Tax=unclassified Sporosarcina TaxID=2647733 RepID=UPI000C16BC5F|nr:MULTISPECIES: ImmA/IrrE family metallo-endopeptidase [unclassified Sporosarcina]PID13808.1 phage portal protein [Sporosarcina sp. P34]PID24872.1 phage portal protein [Sporosarcina sp. P7]
MKISSLSSLEEKVFSIYHSLNIIKPSQIYHMDLIEDISNMFKIKTYYFDESSEANNMGGIYRIFLNKNQSKQAIWQDFAHELAHILGHEGYQCSMHNPFREYQEWQAEQFAYHFCIPTFLLNQMNLPQLQCEAIGLIASIFNTDPIFASERLDKWLRSRESDLFQKHLVRLIEGSKRR